MEAKSVSNVLKNLGEAFSKNSPTILTGVACAGLVTTVIFAVRATPRANEIIQAQIGYNHDGIMEYPTKKEIVQLTWKCYIPTVVMGSVTIGCIIMSNQISVRRNAALTGLYSLTEAAFKEYQNKVVETIGKNKELKVRDEITSDKLKASPPGENEVIFTGKGEHLCYDSLSGRYFKSDIEKIRRAINDLNETLRDEMWVSLNDLYYALGLSNNKLGDLEGWHIEHGNIKINFSSQLTDNGEPCLVLNYQVTPRYI